jgi:hypothetical protein
MPYVQYCCFYCRPDTRYIDRSLSGASYSDFRRLKRLRLANENRFTIWGPSPSPEPEPLLEESDPDVAGRAADGPVTADAANGGEQAGRSEELQALDQEELALFMCAPALTLTTYDSVIVSFVAEM